MDSKVVSYAEVYRSNCEAIFDSNLEAYFTPKDRDDFMDFLEEENGPFFVYVDNGKAIACGGYWLPEPGVASLTWGMVHAEHQRRGIGSELLAYRLSEIERRGAKKVICETSPLTSDFFVKHGFMITSSVPDGFGPDIDQVTMLRML